MIVELGEYHPTLSCVSGMEPRPGSMGKPAPGYDVQIVDDVGKEVDAETRGNIAFKSHLTDNGQKIKHPGSF